MGLKKDVIILIYYMANSLTFEILNIILRNFSGIIGKLHENRLILSTEKLKKT